MHFEGEVQSFANVVRKVFSSTAEGILNGIANVFEGMLKVSMNIVRRLFQMHFKGLLQAL